MNSTENGWLHGWWPYHNRDTSQLAREFECGRYRNFDKYEVIISFNVYGCGVRTSDYFYYVRYSSSTGSDTILIQPYYGSSVTDTSDKSPSSCVKTSVKKESYSELFYVNSSEIVLITFYNRIQSSAAIAFGQFEISCTPVTESPTMDPTADPTQEPTQPTIDPTFDPTMEPTTPSQAPSQTPTVPSFSPSSDPTKAPSTDPSKAPTMEPTVPSESPTKTPTQDPTGDPTMEPTVPSQAPSAAPTMPTIDPTTYPSQAPTFCDDIAGQNSSKGLDQMSFDYDEVNITLLEQDLFVNRIEEIIGDVGNSYLGLSVACVQDDYDCIIKCSSTSCLLSSISSDIQYDEEFSNKVIIDCMDTFSCFASSFISHSNSNITIICREEDSCSQMTVNVTDFNSFKLYCISSGSCSEMKVYLETNEQNNTVYDGSVTCIEPNSCDELHLTTNSELTQLIMFEYSDSILFDNGIGYLFEEENIVCNQDRWIQFRTYINETVTTISDQISLEYTSNAAPLNYPCAGIEVICGNSTLSKCSMEYEINTNKFNQIKSTYTETRCYWINVEDIQDLACIGQCASSPTEAPTSSPTLIPTAETDSPTFNPTADPTIEPTFNPSQDPTTDPTDDPTSNPTQNPTKQPTVDPTMEPTEHPTTDPTNSPSTSPTIAPSTSPSFSPTRFPIAISDFDYYVIVVFSNSTFKRYPSKPCS